MLGALQQAGLADLCATGDGDVLLLGGEAVVGSLKLSVSPWTLALNSVGCMGVCACWSTGSQVLDVAPALLRTATP